MVRFFLVSILAFFSLNCKAQASNININRFLYIDQVITRSTLRPVQDSFEKMITVSQEPVTIILSSPGGSVVAGMSFVNLMQSAKAMGVVLNCYVLDMAASMAFQILTQCTNRYALPTSYLLWHGVRTNYEGPITAEVAKSLYEDIDMMDVIVREQLSNALKMSSDEIERHFHRETLWAAKQLASIDKNFLVIKTDYADIVKNLSKAVRCNDLSPFFGFNGLFYIWDRYDPTLVRTQQRQPQQ